MIWNDDRAGRVQKGAKNTGLVKKLKMLAPPETGVENAENMQGYLALEKLPPPLN